MRHTVVKNQTLADIAIQRLGSVDALPQLLAANANLGSASELDLAYPLAEGIALDYSEDMIVDKKVVSEINGANVATHQPAMYRVAERVRQFYERINRDMTDNELLVLDRAHSDFIGKVNLKYAGSDLTDYTLDFYPLMGSTLSREAKGLYDYDGLSLVLTGGVMTSAGVKFSAGKLASTIIPVSDLDPTYMSVSYQIDSGVYTIACNGVTIRRYINGVLNASGAYTGQDPVGVMTRHAEPNYANMIYSNLFMGQYLDDTQANYLFRIMSNFSNTLTRL